jgi:hypothetical protein
LARRIQVMDPLRIGEGLQLASLRCENILRSLFKDAQYTNPRPKRGYPAFRMLTYFLSISKLFSAES